MDTSNLFGAVCRYIFCSVYLPHSCTDKTAVINDRNNGLDTDIGIKSFVCLVNPAIYSDCLSGILIAAAQQRCLQGGFVK